MDRRTTIVTTSWDDGDFADLKLAELLHSKGIHGTFYIPINYRDRPLEHSEIRTLASAGFEIGAHGFSHRSLCGLPPRTSELRCSVSPAVDTTPRWSAVCARLATEVRARFTC